MKIKREYKKIGPKLEPIEKAEIEKEIEDLESKFDDDDYQAPHESFKIKFSNWNEKDESQLKSIVRGYFQLDDRRDKKTGGIIKGHKGNTMAMRYTLAKLKLEKLYDRLKGLK